MKFSLITAAILPLASAAFYSKQQYQSGEVMAKMMARKESQFAAARLAGDYNSTKWTGFNRKRRGGRIRCVDGKAEAVKDDPSQTFKCKNIDLYDFKSHAELGSALGEGSGSWGWEYDGREFIAIGQRDGAAFAEVTKQGKLVYLGRLPQQSVPSIWREMKVNGNFLLIGSEALNHNVQIFDLTKLLKIDPKSPKTFNTTTDLTGLFKDLPIGRTHNVVVNEELNYAVAVGAQPRNSSCASGLIFIDMTDPTKPFSPGCAPQDGYVHDAQCIVYRGPDTKYYGRDICYGYNENSLTIYDVSNKTGPQAARIISNTTYEGATYTHQGWIIDPNWQSHLIIDDEIDEEEGNGLAADGYPVTYIFDLTSLEKPVYTGHFKASVKGIDHNQYIHDGLAYQSNYGAGLRIHDISTIPEDPTGAGVEEIAYFDIFPEDDDFEGGGIIEYVGTWSHYTFPSGFVVVNTIERGPFVVKMNGFKKRGFGKSHVRRG